MWKILRIFDYVHKEMQGKFFLASVQPLLYNILNASKSRCGGMADAPHSKCGGKPCRFKSGHRHQTQIIRTSSFLWGRVRIICLFWAIWKHLFLERRYKATRIPTVRTAKEKDKQAKQSRIGGLPCLFLYRFLSVPYWFHLLIGL